jgi:hypothetical protein
MYKPNKLLKAYYDFFDTKLSDSSIVVWIIWLLIIGVWYFWATPSYGMSKASLLEYDRGYYSGDLNIVEVWGKKYKITFEEYN